MNIAAIIPAAGSGSRAGFSKNKILQKIGGSPVIARTVSAFAQNAGISRIVVCANEADRKDLARELAPFDLCFASGGATRTESVKNALGLLAALPCPPDYVLIHDAARPFVSQKIINDCIDTVRQFGSAVCALPCTDTAVLAESGFISDTVERDKLFALQTPQGFAFAPLYEAYGKITESDAFTDDSGVYKKYVAPPRLFAGEKGNIKLTFAEDFQMETYRTGIGTDTHAFGAEKDHIVLGGVKIPSERGLIAHSDGDVLCHALMDALLSAAGLADIGHHFPDTDPAYKGADSLALLARVYALLQERGFSVVNVSAAISAERPKLAPYIAQMKKNLADVLHISEQCVGISAGTNEGLGYIGRGEGITVIANALLRSVF